MTHFHESVVAPAAVKPCGGQSEPDVGAVLQTVANIAERREVSPQELEAHIGDCARLMEAAMQRWEQYGCFNDCADVQLWKRRMYEAIKARSPAAVAAMEQARGLA